MKKLLFFIIFLPDIIKMFSKLYLRAMLWRSQKIESGSCTTFANEISYQKNCRREFTSLGLLVGEQVKNGWFWTVNEKTTVFHHLFARHNQNVFKFISACYALKVPKNWERIRNDLCKLNFLSKKLQTRIHFFRAACWWTSKKRMILDRQWKNYSFSSSFCPT